MTGADSSEVSPHLLYAWASLKASVFVALVGIMMSIQHASPVHFVGAILTIPFIVATMTLVGYARGRWLDAA